METAITPQILAIGGLSLFLLIALVLRHFSHRKPAPSRFGESHSQAIADMGDRTRSDAQRKEMELLGATSPRRDR